MKLFYNIQFFLFIFLYFVIAKYLMFFFSKKPINKTILYLENFPIENAGYQYRAAKWAELLRAEGYKVDIWTLCENKALFENKIAEKPFSKFLLFALKKRFKQVLASRKYETVIVRRELLWFNDYGNLFLDRLLLKIHPNAILDFDDDIAAAKNQPKKVHSLYSKLLLENGNKFNDSLRLYKRFFVASNYLKDKVFQENPTLNPEAVRVIPTCVDYDNYPAKEYPEKIEKLTFGWIGGDHNYLQLDTILPILNKLSVKEKFKLLVIGGTPYERDVNFELEFRKWSLETEVHDILNIDVGLMPLEENVRTKGKGGFKLIQYMGLGVVSVASAITINNEIVDKGNDSFLCKNEKDWLHILSFLLNNKNELKIIGEKARKKVLNYYSFKAHFSNYRNNLHNMYSI
jgi:glycosyltransferase involved in cell wall biosynthesis